MIKTDKPIYSCPACKMPITTHLTRQHCIDDLVRFCGAYARELEATRKALQNINVSLWAVIKHFHGEAVEIPKEAVVCTFEDGVLVEPTAAGLKMSLVKRPKEAPKTA
jgi:hypothetical protein